LLDQYVFHLKTMDHRQKRMVYFLYLEKKTKGYYPAAERLVFFMFATTE